MKPRKPRNWLQFETTSIHLATALLVQVPGATLAHVSPTPSIDGKKLITVSYPPDQAQVVEILVEQFRNRQLVVPLYVYNRVLNSVRDRLLQREGSHAI